MRKYIGILEFDNGTKIPATLEAKDDAEALLKVAKYCVKKGFFPYKIEVHELSDHIGIIEIKG